MDDRTTEFNDIFHDIIDAVGRNTDTITTLAGIIKKQSEKIEALEGDLRIFEADLRDIKYDLSDLIDTVNL